MKITKWTEEIFQKNYEKKIVKKWIFCEKITFDQIFEFFVKFIAVIIPLYENVIRGGSNETIWFNEIKLFPFEKRVYFVHVCD